MATRAHSSGSSAQEATLLPVSPLHSGVSFILMQLTMFHPQPSESFLLLLVQCICSVIDQRSSSKSHSLVHQKVSNHTQHTSEHICVKSVNVGKADFLHKTSCSLSDFVRHAQILVQLPARSSNSVGALGHELAVGCCSFCI